MRTYIYIYIYIYIVWQHLYISNICYSRILCCGLAEAAGRRSPPHR